MLRLAALHALVRYAAMIMSTAPTVEDIAAAIRSELPEGVRAVLFGSRARGDAIPRSDWDIGILGPEPVRPGTIDRIREALESLRTLHSFDVVDLRTVPEGFREQALASAQNLI